MRSVLAREMLFFTSLLLLLSACRLVDGASIVSGEESARLKVHDAGGVLRLGTNNTDDLFKRQTTCATIAPLCAGTGDCCSGICCAIECCIGGATCTGGQCVANAPPSASSASAPQADPSSSAVQSSSLAQSSSEAQSSSTSSSDSSPSSAQASSSSPPAPPSSSSLPAPPSSSSPVVGSSTSALADPSMSSMSIAPLSSIPGSSSTSIAGADTSTSVSGSQPAAAPSASGSLSATASSTAVSILPLIDYNVTTVSDGTGPQVVTFGTFTDTSTYVYVPSTTERSSAAPSQEPLVVQQVPPTVTNNPEVQMQYQPTDAWETSGSQGQNGNGNGSDGGNDNGSSQVINRPIPLCNNGTKISNQAGSAIMLTFTGIEASLQMIPSLRGSAYSVQLDNEDPEDFDSFKADANQCQVSIGWTRTNLPNTVHNITVIVKGNTAGGGGDPNSVKSLEFNGLTFTGPASPPAKKGTSKWVIVGVAAGGVVLVAILVILVILIIRRRRQRSETATPINDTRASTVGGSTMGGGRRLTHATSPRSSTYAPSHMRNNSGMSSPPGSIPGSLPGSPSMRPWGLPQTQTPSIHQRQASWVDGGAPFGTTYIPPPPAQPYSIPYNAGGSPPRQAFVPGHSRGPSSMSDNRNPFEG